SRVGGDHRRHLGRARDAAGGVVGDPGYVELEGEVRVGRHPPDAAGGVLRSAEGLVRPPGGASQPAVPVERRRPGTGMKVAFVSLMTGAPWGGSEELWAAAAREALARGIAVETHLPAWPTVPDRVAELAKRGAVVSYWQRYDPRITVRAANKLLR